MNAGILKAEQRINFWYDAFTRSWNEASQLAWINTVDKQDYFKSLEHLGEGCGVWNSFKFGDAMRAAAAAEAEAATEAEATEAVVTEAAVTEAMDVEAMVPEAVAVEAVAVEATEVLTRPCGSESPDPSPSCSIVTRISRKFPRAPRPDV